MLWTFASLFMKNVALSFSFLISFPSFAVRATTGYHYHNLINFLAFFNVFSFLFFISSISSSNEISGPLLLVMEFFRLLHPYVSPFTPYFPQLKQHRSEDNPVVGWNPHVYIICANDQPRIITIKIKELFNFERSVVYLAWHCVSFSE